MKPSVDRLGESSSFARFISLDNVDSTSDDHNSFDMKFFNHTMTALAGLLTFNAATTLATQTLFMTEVADPANDFRARYVEFYSPDSAGQVIEQVDGMDLYLGRAVNSDPDFTSNSVKITGETIGSDGFFVVCYSVTSFDAAYPTSSCDLGSGFVNSNGDDAYVVCV